MRQQDLLAIHATRRENVCMLSAALAAAVLVAANVHAAPPATGQVVSQVVAAYGGRALERARIVRQQGTVTSLMRGGKGTITRLFVRPASLRIDIVYPGKEREVRVLHDGRGERDGVDVTGTPAYAAMVLQAARLALPLSLAERDAHLTDRGEVDRDGRRARVLVLALPQGMELAVEIDPATFRIVRSSASMPFPGGRMEFVTDYSAFKKFGGVLFATHEESYAGGQHTGATNLDRIEILSKVPEDAFPATL